MIPIYQRAFGLAMALCFVALSVAAADFNPQDYRTKASFELAVERSKYVKAETSRIAAQSAIISLAHGLEPGNSDGLEVLFFTRPVTEAALPDIMNNDAEQMRRSSHAVLALYLNKQRTVSQVNLSYVVPGTTIARTVAWKADDLKRYFSDMSFTNGRLRLKSKGVYTESDPGQDAMRLSWDIDLDLPVKREVQR
jgi:hypothetical protein